MQSVAQGWLLHRLTSSAFMLGPLGFLQFLPVLLLDAVAGVHGRPGEQAAADPRDADGARWSGGAVRAARLVRIDPGVDGAACWRSCSASSTRLTCRRASRASSSWWQRRICRTRSRSARRRSTLRESSVRALRGLAGGDASRARVDRLGRPSRTRTRVRRRASGERALHVVVAGGADADRRARAEPRAATAGGVTTLAEGVRYAWSVSSIRNLLVLLGITGGLGFQFLTLLPVYVRDLMHADANTYGLLVSAFGVAARCSRPC